MMQTSREKPPMYDEIVATFSAAAEFVRQMVEQNSAIMKMIPRIEGAL